jgi:hypothetical protein
MKYAIGDKFWRVDKVFNRLTGQQKKLKMVDAEGIEWYRYDKDSFEFDLMEVEIVGTFNAVIEGHSIWNEEEYIDRYCMEIGDFYEDVCEDELNGEHQGHYIAYFQKKEEAELYIKEQREVYVEALTLESVE